LRVSSDCGWPRRTWPPPSFRFEHTRPPRNAASSAHFFLRLDEILARVSGVSVCPRPVLAEADRRPPDALRSFSSRHSSSVMPAAAAASSCLRRCAARTPARIFALVSGEWDRPAFQGVRPLLAAEIFAREAAVCGRPSRTCSDADDDDVELEAGPTASAADTA